MLSVYAGNDTGIYVEAVQILDLSTGLSTPATASATAVFSLETTGGTALVGPITMSFIVGSTGDFVGLLPAAATSALRGTYRLHGTVQNGVNHSGEWLIPLEVITRD